MPTKSIPLSDEDRQAWTRRIDRSRSLRQKRREIWKTSLRRYLGTAEVKDDTIAVNKEFPFVEMKRSLLLFQVPEVQLEPLLPGLEQATLLFQAVINHELGPDAANLKVTIDETLFDVLTMGIGPTKIGYAAYLGERDVEQPQIDPLTGQPILDPQTGQPALETRTVPTLLKEEYFWKRVSPDKFLIPAEFEGMNFDEASWLGYEFRTDLQTAIRQYDLPKDFDHVARPEADDSLSGEKTDVDRDTTTQEVTGVELWYYAARYDPKEPHPDQFRVLTLIDGWDKAVRHANSPFQQIDAAGKLGGMKGNPIHVMAIRGVANCAYPPSDVELSIHISEELSKTRTQQVQQRETSIPMRWIDRNSAEPEMLTKILSGTYQGVIPTDGPGDRLIGEVARAQYPRENFSFQQIADTEYEDMWALPRSARGLRERGTPTATEVQATQSSSDVRLDAERGRVLGWFTTGARKFGALLQLFKTDVGYVEVLGSQAATPSQQPSGAGGPGAPQPPQQPPQQPQGLQAWDRTKIQGEFLFKIKPDSGLRIDAAARRKEIQDVYNLTVNDPNSVRVELLRMLYRSHNMDPSRLVVDKPPEPPKDPPTLSLAFKGEDLLNPLAVQIMAANGLQIPPDMLKAAEAVLAQQAGQTVPGAEVPHGGAAQGAEIVSKHALRGDGTAPAGVAQRPTGVP